jgi:hypothetical protein
VGGGSGGTAAEGGGGSGAAVVAAGGGSAGGGGVGAADGLAAIGVAMVDDDCGAGVEPQATPRRIHADDATSVARTWVRIFALYRC